MEETDVVVGRAITVPVFVVVQLGQELVQTCNNSNDDMSQVV